MTEAIVVAVIAGASSIAGQMIISFAQRKKDEVERARREQHVDDRLNNIETKLDIHNGYAEKFTDIQTDIAVIKAKLERRKNNE